MFQWVCTTCIPTGKSASSHTISLMSCKTCRLTTVMTVFMSLIKREGEKAAFTETHWWTLNKQMHDASTLEIQNEAELNMFISRVFLSSEVIADLKRVEVLELCMGQTEQSWAKLLHNCIWYLYKVRLAWGISTNTHLYIVQKLCPQHCTVTLSPSKRLTKEKRQKSFRHSVL